jgi:hypothetical protein
MDEIVLDVTFCSIALFLSAIDMFGTSVLPTGDGS